MTPLRAGDEMMDGLPGDLHHHCLSQIRRAASHPVGAPVATERQGLSPSLEISDRCSGQREPLLEESDPPVDAGRIVPELHALQLEEGDPVADLQQKRGIESVLEPPPCLAPVSQTIFEVGFVTRDDAHQPVAAETLLQLAPKLPVHREALSRERSEERRV